jgi:Spy/CpxP family protein refolding chaperone
MKTNIKNLKRIFLVVALAMGGYGKAADMDGMGPVAAIGAVAAMGDTLAAIPAAQAVQCGADGHPGGPGMAGHGPAMGPGMHGPGMMPPPMPPFGMPAGEPPFLRGLELSEAQRDKVFAILHAEMPYLRDQHKAAAKAHEALRAMADGAQYDDAKAASLSQAAAQAMANIELQHVRTEQKLLALLTPEQRKQLSERQPHHPPRS